MRFNFQIIERIIRKNGVYFISEKTLKEISEGAFNTYQGKDILIRECHNDFERFLASGYQLVESPIKDHKSIISIR